MEYERPPEQVDDRTERIAIWISCLAAYNDGTLHGDWVDATQDPEDLHAAAQHILRTSPIPLAEEVAIFDHEGFGAYKVHEYESFDVVSAIAKGIEQHGRPFSFYAEMKRGEIDNDELQERFEEDYIGSYAHEDEVGEALADSLGMYEMETEIQEKLPESIRYYFVFDVDAWTNDLKLGGDMIVCDDGYGVHAFWNR